jgi:hypothetical protein
MTTDNTYNGWRNVETWRVQLHLANDEWTANHMLNRARWHVESPRFDNWEDVSELVWDLQGDLDRRPTQHDRMADYVRDHVTSHTTNGPDLTDQPWAMFKADTVAAALERVDWESIANHWLVAARDEMTTHGVQP